MFIGIYEILVYFSSHKGTMIFEKSTKKQIFYILDNLNDRNFRKFD